MDKDITKVECLEGTRLRLTFEDHETREVDVRELVRFEGVFEAIQDASYFRQVNVNPELGTVVWPNGADLCPDVLYACRNAQN